jgi:prepilin-type N-terminal cleavage/methylation domain-containing protein
MKKIKIDIPAFTLIEIIIAMSIFGIIMVSVLSIFLFSSQMSTRVEMNRIMQENIKNVTEDIAENIRKSNLSDVIPDNLANSCSTL